MGGRGSGAKASARGTTTPTRTETIQTLKAQMDTIGSSMGELARYATSYGKAMAKRTGMTESEIETRERKYRKAQKEYNEIRQEYNRLRDIELERQNREAKPKYHTFVNSYGEATTREITSSTYERAQRRLEKRIRQWMVNYR